jgi:hypothetical protein
MADSDCPIVYTMTENGAEMRQSVSWEDFEEEKSKRKFVYPNILHYLCSRKQTKRKWI